MDDKPGQSNTTPLLTGSRPGCATLSGATNTPATSAPATSVPATSAPAISAPATLAPATSAPAKLAPATSAPATSAPATSAPAKLALTTSAPAKLALTTSAPATSAPVATTPILSGKPPAGTSSDPKKGDSGGTPGSKNVTSGSKKVTSGSKQVTSGSKSVTPGNKNVSSTSKNISPDSKVVTSGSKAAASVSGCDSHVTSAVCTSAISGSSVSSSGPSLGGATTGEALGGSGGGGGGGGGAKQLKRKLQFGAGGSQQPQQTVEPCVNTTVHSTGTASTGLAAADDEDKKTPKRRKSVHSDTSVGSPPPTGATAKGAAPGGGSTPGRLCVPLSERQQLALIMQQYADTAATQDDLSPRPSSPGTPVSGGGGTTAGKKTPLDKKIHKKNEKGETLLHIAAIKGDTKQCRKLIKAGADVNVTDNAGWTPLHEACNHGHLTVAKQLLRSGANVNVQGGDRDTPLHDASGNAHEQLVELLLHHGANPLQQNSRGKAPVDIAASDRILRLLKSETIANSSSGGSVASDVRSPTSPDSMSEEDNKDKKDSDSFFSHGSRGSLYGNRESTTANTTHSGYQRTSRGGGGTSGGGTNAHSPTSTSGTVSGSFSARLGGGPSNTANTGNALSANSPPKAPAAAIDPYDFSDNDASLDPSSHPSASGPSQRLTLKLMKSQKEKREREERSAETTSAQTGSSVVTSGSGAIHSPKHAALMGGGSGAADDSAPPPSKRFKSFSSRIQHAGSTTNTVQNSSEDAVQSSVTPTNKFGVTSNKFDPKATANSLDRLSPASFSSQDSDMCEPMLDISALSGGGKYDSLKPSSTSALTFANVAKVTSSDNTSGSLLGKRSADSLTRQKQSGNSRILGRKDSAFSADGSAQPDSQMPKLSQESGRFSPDSFGGDDSEDNALQIDFDSGNVNTTTTSALSKSRENSSATGVFGGGVSGKTNNSHSNHVGSSSNSFLNSTTGHFNHKPDISVSSGGGGGVSGSGGCHKRSPPVNSSSGSNRSPPSPFHFTDSPTNTIAPGQSLYSNKFFDRKSQNNPASAADINSNSSTGLGAFAASKSNKGEPHRTEKSGRHGKDGSRQSPVSAGDSLGRREDSWDSSSEVSQSSVKSAGASNKATGDNTRHFSSVKLDSSSKEPTSGTGVGEAGDSMSPKPASKQEGKGGTTGGSQRYSPTSSTTAAAKVEAKDLKSLSVKVDKTLQDSGDSSSSSRSPKLDKENNSKNSTTTSKSATTTSVENSRASPAGGVGSREGKQSPPAVGGGSGGLSHHKSDRCSTKPDRGDRDSPKSDKSDKFDHLKVPPLKIIIPQKGPNTFSEQSRYHHHHHNVSSSKTSEKSRGGSTLPYVINPTQDSQAPYSSDAVVGSTGIGEGGAPTSTTATPPSKNSRSSSRASSVASGGAGSAGDIDVINSESRGSAHAHNEDSNPGLVGSGASGVTSSSSGGGINEWGVGGPTGLAHRRSRRDRGGDRDGPRTEDDESRDGSCKGGEGGERGEASERRVTRSQLRSQQGHGAGADRDKDAGKEDGASERDRFEESRDTQRTGNGSNGGAVQCNQGGRLGDNSSGGADENESHAQQQHIHPRKRRLRQRQQQQQQQQDNSSSVDLTHFSCFPRSQHHDKTLNPYEMYLDIRKKVAKRQRALSVITPKAPHNFSDYLMVSGNYMLQGQDLATVGKLLSPPASVEAKPPLKELFREQELARFKLRLQHHIEREKLMLSLEQEIVRVHGQRARALANQATPLSACTVLRDQDIYNPISDDDVTRSDHVGNPAHASLDLIGGGVEKGGELKTGSLHERGGGARQRYNGRTFHNWLQDVDDKFEKIKEQLLMRHHHEAESLHAVQKLEWEWRMKDSLLWDAKASPQTNMDDRHVPMVHVNDEFELPPSVT